MGIAIGAVPAAAQIGFNAAQDCLDNGGTTTSLSCTVTTAGANRVGIVAILGDSLNGGVDDLSSVTWAGTACTLIQKLTTNSSGAIANGARYQYMYVCINPPASAQTVQVTAAASHYLIMLVASYTGVNQVTPIDTSTTSFSTSETATTWTTSVTTGVANAWTVIGEGGYTNTPNANTPPSAGTGATRRTFTASFGGSGLFDSAGPIASPGSTSMTTTRLSGSTVGIAHIMASLNPAASPGPKPGTLVTLGVGR